MTRFNPVLHVELKATPRSTPVQRERRLSKSPSSVSNAVNIPNSPSTSPFIRERKSSTGSSAGSVLAKAISKASVRLFGTSMPSPPKDHHHLVGSPHGFMSHHQHDTSNNRTMKRIERLACMAHAVAKYGDKKYDLLNQKEGNVAILAEEAVSLYVKSLALLEMGLDIAQQYWHQHRVDEEEDKKSVVLLNDAVQWMRDKFNDCLDRAESIKYEATDSSCVEKLLYDCALEMVYTNLQKDQIKKPSF
jgi:serine/threonine-protein kinase ULK/ATG1